MTDFYKKFLSTSYPDTGSLSIAAFGDSVTHGAFECIEGAPCVFDFEAVYHNRLRELLCEEKPWMPVSVLNAGIAGDCAKNALTRIDRDIISHKPDLCIVAFALNDVNDPLNTYTASLTEIFSRLHGAGIETVFQTPNMLNTYVRPDTVPMFRDYAAVTAEYQNSGRMDTYIEAARACATAAGVPVADSYAIWKSMYQNGTDTTALLANAINHPSRGMHRLFAKTLYTTITGKESNV